MSFPVVKRRTYRERLRLLRPCKPKAETEYNVAYKKWPMKPSSLRTFRVKDPLELKKPFKYANSSKTKASSGYQESVLTGSSASDQASGRSYKHAEPQLLTDEWFKNNQLSASLKSKIATIHERPYPKYMSEVNKKYQERVKESHRSSSQTFAERLRTLNDAIAQHDEKNPCPGTAAKPREAWVKSGITGAEKTRRDYPCARNEGRLCNEDQIKMGDLCFAIDRMDCWNNADDQRVDCSYIQELPSEHSVKQVRSESIISSKRSSSYVDDRDKRKPSVVRPGSARVASAKSKKASTPLEKTRKKVATSGGVTEANLKNLYQNLSPEEVKQLQKSYNGLIGTKRDKSKNPSKTNLEDVDTFRQTAWRATNYPYMGRTLKDWKTSYNCDYGGRKLVREIFENVNNLYKADFIDPKPRPGSPIPGVGSLSAKVVAKNRSALDKKAILIPPEEKVLSEEEKNRIIADADKIMEREYKNSYSLDGKSKLATETSSGAYGAYKSWGIKRPPVPIWSDKTAKSLGSAHWNLPGNKEDDWKLKAEHAIGDENFQPSGCVNPAFKLHVEEPKRGKVNQEGMKVTDIEGFYDHKASANKKSSDPFIALYYPNTRTTSNYLTEYMRKFHHKPLPQKRARV